MVNYQKNWASLGFDESDWAETGSDRLIDAMFAWGPEDTIRERIRQHLNAGADHVCIQPVAPSGDLTRAIWPCWRRWLPPTAVHTPDALH
ncbi:MAG: hypothetical protein ABW203_07355 [Novosphingobium sp.]